MCIRIVVAKLYSLAGTGYTYTFRRPRTAPKMELLKYDPFGKNASKVVLIGIKSASMCSLLKTSLMDPLDANISERSRQYKLFYIILIQGLVSFLFFPRRLFRWLI